MSSPVMLSGRCINKPLMQVWQLLYEFEKNPKVKIDVWSPNETYASRLISIAERWGIDLEMTAPKKRESTDLWVSQVRSVKRQEVV